MTPSTLYEAFCQTVARRGDAIAWLERSPSVIGYWSWFELDDLVRSTASHFLKQGIQPGQRIVNLAPNCLEWAVLDLACSAIGAIHAPIDPRLPSSQQSRCIELVDPVLIFDNLSVGSENQWRGSNDDRSIPKFRIDMLIGLPSSRKTILKSIPKIDDNQAACILFTSGTMGAPRGVLLSHRNLVTNALAKLDAMPEFETDHRLNLLPFAHAYARTCELSTWVMSGCAMDCAHGIEEAIRYAMADEPTLINGVPLFYERLYEQWGKLGGQRDDLFQLLGSKIRRLASGGSPLPNSIRSAFADVGLPIYQGYGLTEASPVVCSNREATSTQRMRLEGVGPTVFGVEAKIDGEGKLWVRGDGVMLGYWNDEQATQSRLIDGWLDTLDRAEWIENEVDSSEPALSILGRVDDTIVLSSGHKIDPALIERTLCEIPEVEDAVIALDGSNSVVAIVRVGQVVKEFDVAESIRDALSDELRTVQTCRVIVTNDSWSPEDGLRHWKGGLNRGAIRRLYAVEDNE